jgi:hypothetical protein
MFNSNIRLPQYWSIISKVCEKIFGLRLPAVRQGFNVVKLRGSPSTPLSHRHFKMRCLSEVEGSHHMKNSLT